MRKLHEAKERCAKEDLTSALRNELIFVMKDHLHAQEGADAYAKEIDEISGFTHSSGGFTVARSSVKFPQYTLQWRSASNTFGVQWGRNVYTFQAYRPKSLCKVPPNAVDGASRKKHLDKRREFFFWLHRTRWTALFGKLSKQAAESPLELLTKMQTLAK